jgi:hypothetical protein
MKAPLMQKLRHTLPMLEQQSTFNPQALVTPVGVLGKRVSIQPR